MISIARQAADFVINTASPVIATHQQRFLASDSSRVGLLVQANTGNTVYVDINSSVSAGPPAFPNFSGMRLAQGTNPMEFVFAKHGAALTGEWWFDCATIGGGLWLMEILYRPGGAEQAWDLNNPSPEELISQALETGELCNLLQRG